MKRSGLQRHSIALAICGCLWLPAATAAQEAGTVSADQVNAAIQELEKMAQAEIDANAVPGLAIAVVFRDELIYARGFGVKDTTTNQPVDADTVFQVASLSKPIGSTVVAALIGDGLITWDSRISDLDPTFEMYDPWVTRNVTIRDMFAHRSGLPDHSGDLLEDLGFTRQEILHRLRYQKPDTSFRTAYAYTNFGLTEAAIAAAMAYGLDWEDAAQEKLYGPLGMTSTSSRYEDFVARPNKALGHVLIDGEWVPKYARDPDTEAPAGGVSSSVNDLAQWMRLQLAGGAFNGEPVVDETALAETHLPQIVTGPPRGWGPPSFYGLGWNVGYASDGTLRLSHSGAFGLGAGTNVNMSPAHQLGIIALTNGSPTGVAEGLTASFLDLALNGQATRDWMTLYKDGVGRMTADELASDFQDPPASPSPARPNGAYLGTYGNTFFGDMEVVERDGGLAIVLGPQAMTFALTHYDRDSFTYWGEGESSTGISGVTFTLGGDGKATEVVLERLDIRGNGSFARVP
jgi:CubicO group peptidase (beta-lactamase class C family)